MTSALTARGASTRAHSDDDHVTIAIPRSALTIIETPRCVSQRTSERVLGVPRRAFLDLVARYREAGGTVLNVGKLRVVEIDPLLAWMTSVERRRDVIDTTAEEVEADPVDAYAAGLGLRLVGGAR